MKKIEATFRIVTPMFLGGAEPEQKASELRVPSLKGALRFWWRAINWGRIICKSENETEALKELFFREGELFGTTDNGHGGSSQSRVLMRVFDQTRSEQIATKMLQKGHKYLLGNGLCNPNDGIVTRVPLKAGEKIQLIFCFRSDEKSESDMSSVMEAIIALGCMGGVGSRSRRGWGSVSLCKLHSDDFDIPESAVPKNDEELLATIKEITKDAAKQLPPKNLPPFSAFSQESRIDVVPQKKTPWDALNHVGTIFQKYRNWYEFKKLPSGTKHQFFPEDHDLILDAMRGIKPSVHPKRSIFGLPHNYYFSSMKAGAEIKANVTCRSRRASPLFIHIHQFPEGDNASIVQTFLKAKFLPDDTEIQIVTKDSDGNKKDEFFTTPHPENWQVITDYLDLFPERKEVIP